ncbi:MAG: sigma-70 family RNA polymerase sigma factor [Rhodospirillales bacterium]|nr:sigma-70 family RNA polymerase sigma factor [Rhodospirillales bacterium]
MTDTQTQERFLRTLTRYEPRVWAFIRSTVSIRADAEDVFQETKIALWRKVEEFSEVENFPAWACSVARIEILRYYQKCKRDRLQFSPQFLETVSAQLIEHQAEVDERLAALEGCIGKLPPRDRALIRQRYFEDQSTEVLAQMIGREVQTVYKRLSRIRRALFECIERSTES